MKQNNSDKKNMEKKTNRFFDWIKELMTPVNKSSLATGMIRVIIYCWLIPYLAISVVLFFYSNKLTENQIDTTITNSMENFATRSKGNLEGAIEEAKRSSYDGVIKKSYEQFKDDGNEELMHEKVTDYLNNSYRYSSVISYTIVMYKAKTSKEYFTYSNIAGGTYSNIHEFKRKARYAVSKAAKDLGTNTAMVYFSDHFYLVRNIVTSDYKPFAVMVMEINKDKVFENFDNMVWNQSSQIYLDDVLIIEDDKMTERRSKRLQSYYDKYIKKEQLERETSYYNEYDSTKMIAHCSMNVNDQKLSYVVKIDKIGVLNRKSPIFLAYIVVVILLGPLLGAIIYYFNNNVSKPIGQLMRASEKIEKGGYGYTMEPFYGNREFGKLIETVNNMSVSLENSFHRIFAEEVAARDANIKALQSQINPHFLNNTLEIINWKVRMSGDTEASRMIEALSVMMEATMNRKGEQLISIREEMKYVDAYLYIIECRFGNKFEFTKEIDESILDIKIPRLIIQPIVENMVDYGGDEYGRKIGKLKIFKCDNYLHIVLENNGSISAEDTERIESLLSETSMESDKNNIGIRNVNLRLKMLYGGNSGLTIKNEDGKTTVSEILVDLDNSDYQKTYE